MTLFAVAAYFSTPEEDYSDPRDESHFTVKAKDFASAARLVVPKMKKLLESGRKRPFDITRTDLSIWVYGHPLQDVEGEGVLKKIGGILSENLPLG